MHEFTLNGISLGLPAGLATPEILGKLADGTYEADEARSAERCVREGMRVLELGAGIGYVTALCARRAGPEAWAGEAARGARGAAVRVTPGCGGLRGNCVLYLPSGWPRIRGPRVADDR